MKKLIVKDIKRNLFFMRSEKIAHVLHSISNNLSIQESIRKNAKIKLKNITKKFSLSTLKSRCKMTINKKRLNKKSPYSRHILLKFIRSGKIYGFQKASW